jgi:ApbE superfamily uncharacterized protein (UPF0280 family)
MAAEARFYRKEMYEGRFASFQVQYLETDLWIGVDEASFIREMPDFCLRKIIAYRQLLDSYIQQQPEFGTSFSPINSLPTAPKIAVEMCRAAQIAQVGPMAGVAGAFCYFLFEEIQQTFSPQELVIENGGDMYLSVKEKITIGVYAGKSPISGKVGIEILPTDCPIGVSTSAATVGPSISLGKTDATMVVCSNPILSDAFASAVGNLVQSPNDIEMALQFAENQQDIISTLIVIQDKMGYKGKLPMKFIRRN